MGMYPDRNFMSVEEYFSSLPGNVRPLMEELRTIIRQSAPGAVELISYNMPAFKLHKILVYYAAHTAHIGFYPANPEVFRVFGDRLSHCVTSKGTLRFPLDKPLPAGLIEDIIKFRVGQNINSAGNKKMKK